MKSKDGRENRMHKDQRKSLYEHIELINNQVTQINTRLDIVLVDHEKRITRAEKGFIWVGLTVIGSFITGAIGLLYALVAKKGE